MIHPTLGALALVLIPTSVHALGGEASNLRPSDPIHQLKASTPARVNFGTTATGTLSAASIKTRSTNTRVEIDLGTSRMTLDLVPTSLRTGGFQVLTVDPSGNVIDLPLPPSRTYRGSIEGQPGSIVAASILGDGLHARVRMSSGEELWIEPSGADHVAYTKDDVIPFGGLCAADDLAPASHSPFNPNPPTGEAAALSVAEIAIDSDFQFFQRHGTYTAVVDRIEAVINTMNLQYEAEVEITHQITAIVVRVFSNQPYSGTNPSSLLNQFANEWNSNFSGITRDVAQFFTGRNVAGGVIGIAQLSAICTLGGYSMVQSDFNNVFACATDLSAHELGHNWGAGHCGCSGNTMNSFITCANDFANVSINAINNHKNSRNCLSGATCASAFVVNRTVPQNVNAYTAGPVTVGQPTTFTVDTNGFQTARIFGVMAPTFRPLDGGIALINPESGSFFSVGPLAGPIAETTFIVTNDPSLCGVTIYSQALLRNGTGPFVVTNAQDLRIGL